MTGDPRSTDQRHEPRASAVAATAPGVLTIDLGRIAGNWLALSQRVAPAVCAAVVKADAYGLGAEAVIPALVKAGCRTFFVATLDEARQARVLAPSAVVYTLDGLMPGTAEAYADIGVRPILGTAQEVSEWHALARARGKRLRAGIQLNTGLNRLGLSPAEINDITAVPDKLGAMDLTLVMSHLACADDPAHPMNERQRRAFETLRAQLPQAPASLAASDGLMLGRAYHFDLVRPGYALYGGQAFRGGTTPVKPVLKLEVRVLRVDDVAGGETVGYSASWVALPTATGGRRRIATLAVGYADGLFRHLSAPNEHVGGQVVLHGHLCPIVGRVSMDLTTVDVTDVPGAAVTRGDMAEIVGPRISIEDMGAAAGSIGYEVLTRLGRRYHRRYVGGA